MLVAAAHPLSPQQVIWGSGTRVKRTPGTVWLNTVSLCAHPLINRLTEASEFTASSLCLRQGIRSPVRSPTVSLAFSFSAFPFHCCFSLLASSLIAFLVGIIRPPFVPDSVQSLSLFLALLYITGKFLPLNKSVSDFLCPTWSLSHLNYKLSACLIRWG